MDRPRDPEDWRKAETSWYAGNHEEARRLFALGVEHASEKSLSSAFYLSQWAYLEATLGGRERFELLYSRAFSLEPNSPFLRLGYARTLWTEFKDATACAAAISDLETLLASDRWDRKNDLAPLAYSQKIETLRAWLRGEPGGPLWP